MLDFNQVISAANNLNDTEFIKWCSQNEVIHDIDNHPLCKKCGLEMHIEYSDRNTDGTCWRCSACANRLSIRYDTWTSDSNLSLRLIVKILAYWCDSRTVQNTVKDLKVSKSTIITKFKEFRKVAQALYRNDISRNPFSGNLPVQIDESHFFKPKYEVGRMLLEPAVWVFGIYDMNSARILMEVVPQRDAQTLVPIIQSSVVPGTTIWSDQWGAYVNLQSCGYPHQTVNHKTQFVTPGGVNTQRIEAIWSAVKRWLTHRSITSRENLEEHLHEYCFRKNIARDFAQCWHSLNN